MVAMLPTATHEVAPDHAPPQHAAVDHISGAASPEAPAEEAVTDFTNRGPIPRPAAFGAEAPPASASDRAFAGTDHLRPDQREYYDQVRKDPTISEKRAHEVAAMSRPLTQADRSAVTAIQRQIATMKPKRIDDPKNPNLVQIELAFDGTGDDREAMSHDTNPAILDDAFQGPKHYERGVATAPHDGILHNIQDQYEFATGAGLQQRIDGAYNYLVNEVNSIKTSNPNAEVVLVVTGFSRGAAAARAFVNELNKRGVPVKSSQQPDGSYAQHYATPHVGVMVLFDTVQMTANRGLDMGIPANVDNVLHLTARDEHRTTFGLTRAVDPTRDDPRITEVALPGGHGDIGGGNPNDYSHLSEQIARQYMVNAGVNIKPEDKQTDVNDPSLRLHDTGDGIFGMPRPVHPSHNPR